MIGIAAFMMYDDFISKKAIALIPFNWSKLAAEFLHFSNYHILVVGTGKWLNRGAGFGLEMTYFGIFKLEFEKTILLFETSTLEFAQKPKFWAKQKKFIFEIENFLFGCF